MKIFTLISLITSFFFIVNVYAVPVCPIPYNITQPDGTIINVKPVGDEYGSSITTVDGDYSITTGDDRYWHYIEASTGFLSGKAGIDSPKESDRKGLYIKGYPVPTPLPTLNKSVYGHTGGICGIILSYGRGVHYANVTLYECKLNESSKKYINIKIVDNPMNPQLSRDGKYSNMGMYVFPYLQSGTYNITVELDRIFMGFTVVDLDANKGTTTANIACDFLRWYNIPPDLLYLPVPKNCPD